MTDIIFTENGVDVLMHEICGCERCHTTWTLSDCEKSCDRYYSCDNVAIANDILAKYDNKKENAKWVN